MRIESFSLLMQQKRVNYSFLIRVLLLLHYSTASCDTDMKRDRVPDEERVLLIITHEMNCRLPT
jgi:hypothetical protein